MWPPTTVVMTDSNGKATTYPATTCVDHHHQLTHQLVIESGSDTGDVCCYGWSLMGPSSSSSTNANGRTGNDSNDERKPTYYLIVCLIIIGVVIMMLTIFSAIIIFVQRKSIVTS